MAKPRDRKQNRGYDTKVVSVRRVAKVNKGGRRLRFSAMVVAGDRKGKVGVGLGKGGDPRSAIEKGEKQAAKAMKQIDLVGDTIPHEIEYKFGAAKVLLRPAKAGTGVIAGSSVRTVLELTGIEDVYAKLLGSNDPIANAYCAYEALLELRSERVLKNMKSMRDRIELKKQKDMERKEREAKKNGRKSSKNNMKRNSNKGGSPKKSKPKKKGSKK
jgi:small subunit ribosomal protein S5